MRHKTIEDRVEFLESAVTGLVDVPRQIQALSAQILQVRGELRDGLSAVRGETRESAESIRDEMREMGETLRLEMRQDLGSEVERLDTALRAEIRNSETKLGTQMRVLHEEVLDRIATISEGGHVVRRQESAAGVPGRQTRTSKP